MKIKKERRLSNNRFNLTNPLAWFLREDDARTTPSPAGTDLKVKRMLYGRRIRGARQEFKNLNRLENLGPNNLP